MKTLNERRDELAELWVTCWSSLDGEAAAINDYKAGFDACLNELRPEIDKFVEVMECAEAALAVSTVATHGRYTPNAFGLKEIKQALTKFKAFMGEK